MKFKDRISKIYKGIKESTKRFPITIGISILLVISLIYLNESILEFSSDRLDKIRRISMVIGLGIPLSLCIDLLKERFVSKNKIKTILSHLAGFIILVLYYFLLLKEINNVSVIRYIGSVLFLIILFFYIPKIEENSYEKYVIKIFSNFFLTMIYSLVLLIGIFAIIFTINSLFDISIEGKYYYYVFLIIFLIFAIGFFLSELPKPGENFKRYDYPTALRILLSYIVIPLIVIYTIILYLYFAKILLQWQWPKGLVSHLVLWYSSISVGIIFLINPILEQCKMCNIFKRYFPKFILPILLMMFISIGQRVAQYGITENRYYIISLGTWVTAMMVYYAIKRSPNNLIVPISLSIIVLNSIFGPLNSFVFSKYSQNKRLNNILITNEMLKDDKVIQNLNIDKKSQKEINNIISYFDTNHSLSDIKVLDKDFDMKDMEKVFGFSYVEYPTYPYDNGEYFYLDRGYDLDILDIQEYEYLINVGYADLNTIAIDQDYSLKYENGDIELVQDKKVLLSQNLDSLAMEAYHKYITSGDSSEQRDIEEMSFEIENNEAKIKIIFNRIGGLVGRDTEEIIVEDTGYILLIKIK